MKVLFVTTFLIFSISAFSQSGKLDNAKKSLTEKNEMKGYEKPILSNERGNVIHSGSIFVDVLGTIVFYFSYGILVESPFELNSRMHDAEIAEYPYKVTKTGNFLYTDFTNYKPVRFDLSNTFVVENKNLYGNNLNIDIRFLKRMGVQVDYVQFFEQVEGRNNQLSVFSAIVDYHRIRTQKLDVWYGLGATYVGNTVNKVGFAYSIGGEWFIHQPVSLLISFKGGLINQQPVNKLKTVLKYYLKRYHISFGYEHFAFGVSNINAFSLGAGVSF